MSLRSSLKAIPLCYRLNARLKSWQMHRQRDRLERHYLAEAERLYLNHGIGAQTYSVKRRQEQRGLKVKPRAKRLLELVWVGANQAQDYGGFLPSLERFGFVSVYRREDFRYGLELIPDAQARARNDRHLIEFVKYTIKRRGRVDALLGQMWGQYVSASTLQTIQRMGITTANVSMDDRLPEMWQPGCGSLGLADGLDLVLTSAPECPLWYACHGLPATFWPMASDPLLFKPAKVKDIPLSFVGNKYGIRAELVDALAKAGITVQCYGNGWPNGPVEAHEVVDIMNRSQMVLGIGTIGHTRDLFTLKLRDFDATMAGAVYVTHNHPDLLRCFTPALEVVTYRGAEDLVRNVSAYMKHPEQAARLGERARARCLQDHTWEQRFEKALTLLGVLKKEGA